MAPHRAVYDLSLESARDRAGIRAAKGRLVVEVAAAGCEGWTINVRFVNQFTLRRGKSSLLDIQNSSYETADGSEMQFASREYVNRKLQQQAKGFAKGGEQPGDVEFSLPKADSFQLPANTSFPLSHTRRLIELAREGATSDEINLYEGSAEQKVFIASSVIGPAKAAGKRKFQKEGEHNKPLMGFKSWPVSVSYYDPNNKSEGEEVPSHQMSFALFDNGVTGDMSIDYGDFKLKGVLSGLEMLEAENCIQ